MWRRTGTASAFALLAICALSAATFVPVRADEPAKPNHVVKVIRDPALGDDAVARMENVIGQSIFERIWVSAPSSTEAADGLGPMFNARSCAACHPGGAHGTLFNKDGTMSPSLLVRLGSKKNGAADPLYGHQLQTEAARGIPPEGSFAFDFAAAETKLADGTVVSLQRPVVTLGNLADGPLAPQTVTGLRLAPAIHGMGPLGRIPVAAIEAMADPEDKNGDGISGRLHWLSADRQVLGRFGWKAVQPTVEMQNAHAFFADMGLSTPLFTDAYGECTERQELCRAAPSGASAQFEDLEVTSTLTRVLDRFVAEAVLPDGPRQDVAPETLRKGRDIFAAAGCVSCHAAGYDIQWPDGSDGTRHIAPYTDLLLHDMGDGLAEDLMEGNAEGREWRTAPLWGLRWAVVHNADAALLHDGRARNILEAILWHGGEALPARDRVASLPAADRQALISFLSSL
ncbi:di-heme oxidoredictase family protein [Dongia sp.]|uniref:di-heme oxidoredictase family protein n=1 Tax=Dongia sp. TaxID=1977262 RepID=UPI0035AF72E9